jgi:Family of unknown function (DUF5689)
MKFISQPEPLVRLFVVCIFLTLVACSDDAETVTLQPSAQFTASTLTFVENEGEKTISILLDKPAASDGVVVLSINTVVPNSFTTIPAVDKGQILIPIEKLQTTVSFKLIPSDNLNLDGCKVVKFTILQASDGITPGSVRDLVVSVNDDEAPAEANFEISSVYLRESEPAGATVNILLNSPAPAAGELVVKIQSSVAYGSLFTTEPAPTGSKIFLHVTEGQQVASIKVFAVNDASFKTDRNVGFRIVDASGGLIPGRDVNSDVTITEDDGHQLIDINSVRSLYSKVTMILQGDRFVEAVVTSIDNTISGRVVVEDESGALPIQFTNSLHLTRGDLILINLNSALLQEFQGVLEVAQVSYVEVVGQADVRSKRMTLEQLFDSGDQFQSQTVQLMAVTFMQADGSTTMLGDRTVTDGARSVTIRTNPQASFRDELVPFGLVNVTGILTIVEGKYYLYPQEYDDIKGQKFMLKR